MSCEADWLMPMAGDVPTIGALDLLASALAGRLLHVAHAVPGEPSWTDGDTVFIEAALGECDQLAALAVQASLLAAGSLAPWVLRRISGPAVTARRYLAIEGCRALAWNRALLPESLSSLTGWNCPPVSDSPDGSLAIALGRDPVAGPPRCFGAIQPGRMRTRAEGGANQADAPQPTLERRPVPPAADEPDGEDEDRDGSSAAIDWFSVSGSGGVLGRWMQRLLRAARRRGPGGGNPGVDAPTRIHRTARPSGAGTVQGGPKIEFAEGEGFGTAGFLYPEWDMYRRSYRAQWCAVREIDPPRADIDGLPGTAASALRRPLARIGLGLDRYHRQPRGDDIDIDAAIQAHVERLAGTMPDESPYIDSLRRRRDLSVLVLLDISGSVAGPAGSGSSTVHEQQRAAAAALTGALHDLGDRVALFAFHSQGRSAVRIAPVKRFDDAFDVLALRRLQGLVPGAYSRLGAAIRHGAAQLEQKGGTSRRLLIVLSDGLAYDHGYERDYGAADARKALAEARLRGTGCLCLTIGADADAASLRRVFGSAAHASFSSPARIGTLIGPLCRSALRAAEVRRRAGRSAAFAQA